MKRSKSFLPIINKDTRVLILGSLPGTKSIELGQYYGHPRNRIWKILANITDNEMLATEAGKFANTIFHPVSTCRMGKDENAVVSDRLIAHGLSNLRIVDASVMPHITSGNTNAPTIMIAEKAADMIIEDSKS